MVYNRPGEVNRAIITDRNLEAGLFTVRSLLRAVVHGLETNDGDPASLIIFDFRFESYKSEIRFKHAAISIKFSYQDQDQGLIDPVVVNMAPYGLFRLGHSTTTNEKTTRDRGGRLSLGETLLSVTGERRSVTEVSHFATISGWKGLRDREFGEPNTAEWDLSENAQSRSGIATQLRAVVLLRRFDNTSKFMAQCSFDVETAGGSWARKLLRASVPLDDPIIFDPKVSLEGNMQLDLHNLGAVDIQELSDAALGMHMAVSGRRDEEEGAMIRADVEPKHDTANVGVGSSKRVGDVRVNPITADLTLGSTKGDVGGQKEETSFVEIGYGSNLNETLFNIASGKFEDVWCKFKRFDHLSLLNLYHYQDRLVQLDSKIHGDGGNITKNQVEELARLLREYRKHSGRNPRMSREQLLTRL